MSDLWLLCGPQLCKAARAWSPAMQRQTHPGDGRAAVEIPVTAVACGKCEDLNGRSSHAPAARTGACSTRTRVLVDQMRTVDASRLGDFAGRLDAVQIGELDRA